MFIRYRFFITLFIIILGLCFSFIYDDNSIINLSYKPVIFPIPDNNDLNVFWFIHLTDIHLSSFKSSNNRIDRFKYFLNTTIPTINPKFIVVTGDLCHAKHPDNSLSEQFINEWKLYRSLLEENKYFDYNYWIDLRGNHDCFDTGIKNNPNINNNPFYQYSVTGHYFQKPVRTFTYNMNNYSSYSIVSIDACPIVGARSPLNFFGKLTKNDLNELENTLNNNDNHTIVIGHYPSSTILSDKSSNGKTFVDILKSKVSLYLCGHLHTAFGNKLHARHSKSLIELELGDFKDNDMYRIIAIDHDIISFTDQKQQSWPVVLITNPKNSIYLLENEPYERSSLSSHIRLLAFSNTNISHIRIEIDNQEIWNKKITIQSKNNLYSIPWQPSLYPRGFHSIKVEVIDKNNNIGIQEHQFSLDGSVLPLSGLAKWIILGPIQYILKYTLIIIDIIIIIFLILIQKIQKPSNSYIINQCYNLKNNTFVYYILLLSWSSMLFVPWFMGKLTSSNHYGSVFVWGIIHFYEEQPQQFVVDYFHTLDTYLLTLFQLFNFLINLFFFWISSGIETIQYQQTISRTKRGIQVLFIYLLSLYQIRNSYLIMKRIGTIYEIYSLLLSPMISWYNSIIIILLIKYLIQILINTLYINNNKIKDK